MNDEIKLTLDGLDEDAEKDTAFLEETSAPKKDIQLTEAEKKQVEEFAKTIDLTNSSVVLQYGVGAQKKISNFSEKTLNSVRSKDLGEVGKLLSDVVTELKSFENEDEKGVRGFFKRSANKVTAMKARYDKAEKNVDEIARALENHQITLMKDISMLDQMYELNENYFKELTMYIMAGNQKLEEVRTQEIPKLMAETEPGSMDAQKVNDLQNMANRFEKKIHDLELTRMVSLQMAPQIRMVQASNTVMAEKIQSTIVNTIPIWKNQMVLALGVHHSEQAAKAQKKVSDLTNELLKKNADTLRESTVHVARESERGIIDVDTIRHTNEQLISALDDVRHIQLEGHENREKAARELEILEQDLKTRLLDRREQ
ncbi:MAG: toxic anion resistance protein [Peptoniphilus sp.]|nr:toxic anion resistance protein [Peptoniphilus sp.]MDD7362890.1 toxic anion resistance protein [Bacillota bacterium]MDY6044869.1 toxic anion resistance protein [Peptoniphilus sp.]